MTIVLTQSERPVAAAQPTGSVFCSSVPLLTISPPTLEFSTTTGGSRTTPLSFTVFNGGSGTTDPLSVLLKDSVSSPEGRMRCDIGLVFKPTAVGQRVGTLSVSNVEAKAGCSVDFSATGL
jgi:hypothetical protein